MNGVELATAWVKIVPSAEGTQGELTKTLGPAADGAADKAGKSAGKKFGAGLKTAALAGVAVAAAGIVQIFNTGMEELKYGEKINAQTDLIAKNTGFKMATEQINDYTLALSKVSGVSEEDLQAAGNSVLKFGNISEENYKKAVASINDLAASGKDAGNVGEMLGKALADPAKAASLLRRQGVMLTEQQKEQIKTFTKAGDTASAQGVILDSLEQTYGGMAEAAGGTLEGNINKLNNAWENMAGDLVQGLMPAIEGFITILQNVVDWISNNEPAFYAILGVIGLLTAAFVGVTVATWAMNTALLANPITWIILAVVALVAALVWLIANWDAVVAWLTDVWNAVVEWFVGLMEGVAAWWNDLWAGISAWFMGIWQGIVDWWNGLINGIVSWWNGIWTNVTNWFKAVWIAVLIVFRNLWNGIQSWWNGIITAIVVFLVNTIRGAQNTWNAVWNAVVNFFKGLWNGVVSFTRGVFDNIGNVIKTALNFIKNTWNGMWDGMVSFFGRVFGGIVGVAKGPINGVISLVNGAIRALNSFKVTIPDWVPGIGGQTWGLSIPTIPGLYKGGTVTASGLTIVGERGPEILNLPKGAQVNPNYDDLREGGDVTFNNYAPLGQSPAQALRQFSNRAKGGPRR